MLVQKNPHTEWENFQRLDVKSAWLLISNLLSSNLVLLVISSAYRLASVFFPLFYHNTKRV